MLINLLWNKAKQLLNNYILYQQQISEEKKVDVIQLMKYGVFVYIHFKRLKNVENKQWLNTNNIL